MVDYNEYYLLLKERFELYYKTCSFDHYMPEFSLLYKAQIGNNIQVFTSPGTEYPANCEITNVFTVLTEADQLYNFNDYDLDHDGYVDNFGFCIVRQPGNNIANGGVYMGDGEFITNDLIPGSTTEYVKIDFENGKSMNCAVASGRDALMCICIHELQHTILGLDDLQHGMGDNTWDAIGSFDGASSKGFYGRMSVINPYFRYLFGWGNFTNLDLSQTIELKNCETDPTHPFYVFEPENSNNQKYILFTILTV
jgi:M6 family metalloprotease-like protein